MQQTGKDADGTSQGGGFELTIGQDLMVSAKGNWLWGLLVGVRGTVSRWAKYAPLLGFYALDIVTDDSGHRDQCRCAHMCTCTHMHIRAQQTYCTTLPASPEKQTSEDA